MSVSCFTSTNSHLCKFLRTTGRDWRNTIYIECGDCQRAASRSCKNLLCAFDTAGAPVIVPVHDVEYLFSTTRDKLSRTFSSNSQKIHKKGARSTVWLLTPRLIDYIFPFSRSLQRYA